MEKSPYYQNVRKSHLLNVGKSDVIGFCSKCQKPFSLQYADNFALVVFWTNRGTNIICGASPPYGSDTWGWPNKTWGQKKRWFNVLLHHPFIIKWLKLIVPRPMVKPHSQDPGDHDQGDFNNDHGFMLRLWKASPSGSGNRPQTPFRCLQSRNTSAFASVCNIEG